MRIQGHAHIQQNFDVKDIHSPAEKLDLDKICSLSSCRSCSPSAFGKSLKEILYYPFDKVVAFYRYITSFFCYNKTESTEFKLAHKPLTPDYKKALGKTLDIFENIIAENEKNRPGLLGKLFSHGASREIKIQHMNLIYDFLFRIKEAEKNGAMVGSRFELSNLSTEEKFSFEYTTGVDIDQQMHSIWTQSFQYLDKYASKGMVNYSLWCNVLNMGKMGPITVDSYFSVDNSAQFHHSQEYYFNPFQPKKETFYSYQNAKRHLDLFERGDKFTNVTYAKAPLMK